MLLAPMHLSFTGLNDSSGYTFCSALYQFKEFMKSHGWTVSKSGYSDTTSNFSLSTDVIDSIEKMSYNTIWFVLQDPSGVKELLFYRNNFYGNISVGGNQYSKTTGLLIAYSSYSKFGSAGCNNNQTSASNPPMAADAVWISDYPDKYGTVPNNMLIFPTPASFDIDKVLFGKKITSNTPWTFHLIIDTEVPYSFYFFIKTIDPISSWQDNTGFFCMDCVNTFSQDQDPVVFWCKPLGIQEQTKVLFSHTHSIRAWYKKTNYSNRQDYVNNIIDNSERFLPTAPLVLANNTNYLGGQTLIAFPNGFENIPQSGTINISPVLPIFYARGNVNLTQLDIPAIDIKNYNILDMPAAYKGSSSLLLLSCNKLYQFMTAGTSVISLHTYLSIGSQENILLYWDNTEI